MTRKPTSQNEQCWTLSPYPTNTHSAESSSLKSWCGRHRCFTGISREFLKKSFSFEKNHLPSRSEYEKIEGREGLRTTHQCDGTVRVGLFHFYGAGRPRGTGEDGQRPRELLPVARSVRKDDGTVREGLDHFQGSRRPCGEGHDDQRTRQLLRHSVSKLLFLMTR
jgi:hypothetical protein